MEQERKGEVRLFFRRWLAHPLRVGALLPSGAALSAAVARAALAHYRTGEHLVELGPGTGAVTRALIDGGVPKERLILVERDQSMSHWLREHFPGVKILHTDANCLDKTLAEQGVGKVHTVVSALPFTSLPEKVGEEIINAIFRSLDESGRMIQFTYNPLFSPIPHKKYGLVGKREALVLTNIPPATVWSFS